MGKVGTAVVGPAIISRNEEQAIARSLVTDKTIHPKDETILRGTLMALIVANGKFRAYAQAATDSDFSNASPNFDLTGTDKAAKHFRIGDVIEGTDGTALGEILTYNPTTGVGTLTGNSANNYSGETRVALADLKLSERDGRVLKDQLKVHDDADQVGVGYIEGFFDTSQTIGLTDEAIAALGGFKLGSDEARV